MQTLFTKSNPLKLALLFIFIFSCILVSATPTITIIGKDSIKHQVNTPYNDSGATAMDSANNNITPFIIETGTVNVNTFGTYKITYTVTDSYGKTSSKTRTVIVGDCIPPVISTVPNTDSIKVCVNDFTFTEPAVTATDNYFTTVNITRTGTYDITVPGDYTITYTATDGAGNNSSYTRVISVRGCDKPVIIFTGQTKYKINVPINLFHGVSVMDSYWPPSCFSYIGGGQSCLLRIIASNLDITKVGTYQVIYEAINGFGFKSERTRLIEIVSCLSITENTSSNKVKIYPNPTTDILTIEQITDKTFTAALSTIEGKTLFTKDLTSTNNTISIGHLTKGIYYLTIKGLNTLYTQKVIITK